MSNVTISPDFQIVIPPEDREALNLKAGQQLTITRAGQGLRLIPVPTLEELREALKGLPPAEVMDDEKYFDDERNEKL